MKLEPNQSRDKNPITSGQVSLAIGGLIIVLPETLFAECASTSWALFLGLILSGS